MRLIDADALKVDYIVPSTTTNTACYPYVSYFQIKDAPTVDAVEVVRCKDCKYCAVDRYADGNVPNYVCIEMYCGVETDGFCAWAERREDVKTDCL